MHEREDLYTDCRTGAYKILGLELDGGHVDEGMLSSCRVAVCVLCVVCGACMVVIASVVLVEKS